MKLHSGALLLGCLAAGTGIAAFRCWSVRMPLKEFSRYALYMAVMDDEICRNELEGNRISEETIEFPPKAETLQQRYHFFLQANRKKDRQQMKEEIAVMEQRLQDSRQYINQPKQQLELQFTR